MTKVISKYQIKFDTYQEILLPVGAEILSVQMNGGLLYLWALVNQNERNTITRFIEIFSTGEAIKNFDSFARKYISTLLFGGSPENHVFEREPK